MVDMRKWNWLKLLWVLLSLQLSESMEYHEFINIDQLEDLFHDENCIEGSFSYSTTGSIHNIQLAGLASQEKTEEKWMDIYPIQTVNELANHNKIDYLFDLIDEEGPAHKKNFIINLKLGKEQYKAEASSIQKAKREAAKLALNSTSYQLPPTAEREPINKEPLRTKTPSQQLDQWVNKHKGVDVSYVFINEPTHNLENHDSDRKEANIYSKSQNVFQVSVKVNDLVEVVGEGSTSQAAKEDGASKALLRLRNSEAFCSLTDSSYFGFLSKSDSPVSQVHQFANIIGSEVNFELESEEGPAHIKRFVFKCNLGKTETLGEGSSKKSAKSAAAEAMLKQLKSVYSSNDINCQSIVKKPSKNKKPKNFVKSVPQKSSYKFDEDEENVNLLPRDLDPVSKLYQIQQAKHGQPPEFSLINEEHGKTSHVFQMKVTIGDLSFVGEAPNKKQAKKNAAEGILKKMGYIFAENNNMRRATPEQKLKDFTQDKAKKEFIPGLNMDSENIANVEGKQIKDDKVGYKKNKFEENHANKKHSSKLSKFHSKGKENNSDKSKSNPKNDLKMFTQQRGIKMQFSDFPKKGGAGFVSTISLTTSPPTLCIGHGADSGESQDRAALSALEHLYKIQLNSISDLLQDRHDDTAGELVQDTVIVSPFIETDVK